MLWGARPPARWMGTDRLPRLSPGTSQRSSADVHVGESRAGDGSPRMNPLSPCPPRRSGARHDPGVVAPHHGHPGDTTRPRRLAAFGSSGRALDRQAEGVTRGSGCKRTGSVVASPALEAKTVAELLRNPDTRNAALSALEAHTTPIELAVSLAAAPALVELMALDASEVEQEQWDRICLLVARLIADADNDCAKVYAAAFGGGRWAAQCRSEGNTMARALLKPAEELTLDDARSIANCYAYDGPTHVRGSSKPCTGVCNSAFAWVQLLMTEDPLISKCGPCFATCSQIRADSLRCMCTTRQDVAAWPRRAGADSAVVSVFRGCAQKRQALFLTAWPRRAGADSSTAC